MENSLNVISSSDLIILNLNKASVTVNYRGTICLVSRKNFNKILREKVKGCVVTSNYNDRPISWLCVLSQF